MKSRITRIYDKNKAHSRKKYILIIAAILLLQVAVYFGVFSKAERVIPIKYINYHTLEAFDSSIDVKSDTNGEYVVLPEIINNREIITYYIEETIEEATNTTQYEPNSTYYIGDAQELTIKVEYGEYITTESNENNNQTEERDEEQTEETETTEEITTEETEQNTILQELTENLTSTETTVEEDIAGENKIVTEVWLGNIQQEGEEGTETSPYKTISQAYNGLQLTKADGTSVKGTIHVVGPVEIENWADASIAEGKTVEIIGSGDTKPVITMSKDWILQGNTTITNVQILLRNNLNIYANGYDLVLGTEGNNESLIIGKGENKYYPTIYGGSNSKDIIGNTNVTIHSGTYQNIYGGSNNKNITGNTNLNIKYVVVNGSVYGGSNGTSITGNTNVTIEDGVYGVALVDQNQSSITGGSNNGAIIGKTSLEINNGTVFNGCITGAGNSTQITGAINLSIDNLTLGEDGNGTNSIYGYGYDGGTIGNNKINLTINNLNGKPKYILGYCYSEVGGQPELGTIKMVLNNINSENTEIYGGSYNGTQSAFLVLTLQTNNVNAKLLSAGGKKAESINRYFVTIDGGNFNNGIYLGRTVESATTGNVRLTGNTLDIYNYTGTGKVSVNNKSGDVLLKNSKVTIGEKLYTSDIELIKSELKIGSIYNTGNSLGNVSIDEDSKFSIIENISQIVIADLNGEGTLELFDTCDLIVKNGINTGSSIKIGIYGDNNGDGNKYVNIVSQGDNIQNDLESVKDAENNYIYKSDYVGHEKLSYWRFSNSDDNLKNFKEGTSNSVYLHETSGDDNNDGTLQYPVKTIKRATEIINETSGKLYIVLLTNLHLNEQTYVNENMAKTPKIRGIDADVNFIRQVDLNSDNGINNIYQNLEFINVRIYATGTVNQSIYANGNDLTIGTGVGNNSKDINIYGGSDNTPLENINNNITISSATWKNIYGGSNTGAITNSTTNVIIKGGTVINGSIYGGSNSGSITNSTTNVNLDNGTINENIYGGNDEGEIINSEINVNIKGGTINKNIYGGSNTGTITNSITNITVSEGILNDNIYAGKNLNATSRTTNIEIKNGMKVKDNTIYAIEQIPTEATKKIAVNLNTNDGEEINFVTSDANSNAEILKEILEIGISNSEVSINKGENVNIDHLNLKDNSNVIVEGALNTNNLTLNSGATLELRENSYANTVIGATENYGTVLAYEGLNINNATGTTTLELGTVTETKALEETHSAKNSFVGPGEIELSVVDEQAEQEKTRTWRIGNVESLEMVYVNGTNGDDSNDGETFSTAVKTLKQAYYYLKNTGGTIVICGTTEITEWPDDSSKPVIITSSYNEVDYRVEEYGAKLNLNFNETAIYLQANTTFENLKINISKRFTMYADGNNLTFGEGLRIENGNKHLIVHTRNPNNNSKVPEELIIKSGSYNYIHGYANKVEVSDAHIAYALYYDVNTKTIDINDIYGKPIINKITMTRNGSCETNINIRTKELINIDGQNKGNCTVRFEYVENSSVVKNVAKIEIINSTVNIDGTEGEGISENPTQLKVENSNLTINSNSNINLGTVDFDNASTIKILNSLNKINGDFNGGGNLYINDGIKLEIAGKVTGSTKVYCNDVSNNQKVQFTPETIISAKKSEDIIDEIAFITPDGTENGTPWKNKIEGDTRFWSQEEININNIIYVSKQGTENPLGTINMPVNSLDSAYRIAKNRNGQGHGDEYYIVLKDDIVIDRVITENLGDIKVVISSKEPNQDIEDSQVTEYQSSLKINTRSFDFMGTTIIENITIDTTGYSESVEFFANGNIVTFGEGIIVNSPEQKYPIIYGGAENIEINNDINLTVNSGKYNMIFGGGKSGTVNCNTITLNIGDINLKGYDSDNDNQTGLFGAGRYADVNANVTLNINSGEFHRINGAGLNGNLTGNVDIKFNGGRTTRLYGGGQNGALNGNANITVGNSNTTATVTNFLRGSGQYSGVEGTTTVNIYNGAVLEAEVQVAAGGYQGNVADTSTLNIYGGTINCDIYGGGWGILGDSTKGQAGNTKVYIHEGATVNGDIYGGGNLGTAVNTKVYIHEGATVNGDIYGGGNLGTAVNTDVIIEATVNNVYGGGNQAKITENTNVYIVAGIINGDVYGGANKSVVEGNTNVKIGKEAVNNDDLINGDIEIKGSIYGGGRTNETGSEDYDFTTDSVIGNVYIDINAKDIDLKIGTEEGNKKSGNIFASGNATKIAGEGYINISNYGTLTDPKKLTSIQRATEVILDNSALWISGRNDTTNEMSYIEYTINRVNDLKLKNNSTLYLNNGVNIVENLQSLDSDGYLEKIVINENNEITQQKVDNRIYLLQGKNMILTAEDGTNGSVWGMMFLGRYDINEDGAMNFDELLSRSYVQAKHFDNHDIEVNGFYTNGETENTYQYIVPTPEDAIYYQWGIGELAAIVYEDIELIASKYSSTAQVTLNLVGLNKPNMELQVDKIDITPMSEIKLVNEENVAAIAENEETANSVFGLTMQSGYQGWKANRKTTYLYDENGSTVQGDKEYLADSSNTTPTLTFNLAHSRNVSLEGMLAEANITLLANYEDGSQDIVEIKLILRAAEANMDYYEGAITPGLKYEVFPSSTTNITSKSSISAYYSIYLDKLTDDNGNLIYNNEFENYYHVLASNTTLPKGTKITLIDKSTGNDEYYYYITTGNEGNDTGETLYKFTDFIKMGSLSNTNTYSKNSTEYYNKENNYVFEEFIVQLNFEDAIINQDYLGQSLKLKLMDNETKTAVLSVNDAIYPMLYNIYNNQEASKLMTITNKDTNNNETIYLHNNSQNSDELNLQPEFTINTSYSHPEIDSNIVFDTTNFDNAEGLNITFQYFEDSKQNWVQLSKEDLQGVTVSYNEKTYEPSEDGAISFKIADAVCNLETDIQLNLNGKSDWETGEYKVIIKAIGSADGINVLNTIASDEIDIVFFSNEYGLDIDLDTNSQIIDKNGKTLNDDNTLQFIINHEKGGLTNPNIRVTLYRRDYQDIYSTQYNLVDLQEFVTNSLTASNNEKEYIVTNNPKDSQEFVLNLKADTTLTTGTYKVKFLVYDGETYIGEVYKMINIK